MDIAHLRSWIGREEIGSDVVGEDLARKFHAMFDFPGDAPKLGEIAPRLIHFCLVLPAAPTSRLGPDAHSREALLAARSELVLASRLAGLAAPIDGVTTSIDDTALIASDARHASDRGFGAKLCIHPRQIEAIRTGFTPDATEIAWANKVLADGDGAEAVDGAMVDESVRIRARALLQRAAAGTAGATD